MNHKQKLKLARRMMSKLDKVLNMPPFSSYAWMKRREAIALRVKRQQARAHQRAVERRRILPQYEG